MALEGWMVWVGVASAVVFVGSLLSLPWLVGRLQTDHFLHDPPRWRDLSATQAAGRLLRNALGIVLVGAGVAMLVLPGQGILTLLAGVALLDVPGKRRAMRRLVSRPSVLRTINRIRARGGHPPLELPPEGSEAGMGHEDP